jgi:hypothetical protein
LAPVPYYLPCKDVAYPTPDKLVAETPYGSDKLLKNLKGGEGAAEKGAVAEKREKKAAEHEEVYTLYIILIQQIVYAYSVIAKYESSSV